MVKISRRLLFTILIAFLVVTPFVLGADFLDPVFSSFRGTNLGQTYVNYAPFIDAIIYIWLFIAIAKKSMPEKMGGQVATALGVILGVAMCVFELTSKFNLGKLGPFAAIILFLIIGIFLYNLMKDFTGNPWAAMSVAFLIIYSVAKWIVPTLFDWIGKIGFLGTILAIMFLVSIIGLVYGIFSLFKGIKSGEYSAFKTKQREGETEKTFHNKNKNDEIALNREKRASENIFKLETELGNINHNIGQLEALENNIKGRDFNKRSVQIQTITELENALSGSWRLQQQLQEAYKKVDRPEYSNLQYREQIKAAAQQLDGFVTKMRLLLTKLYEAINESKISYENESSTTQKNFDDEISKVITKFEEYIKIESNAKTFINDMKNLDAGSQQIEDEKLQKLSEHITERQRILEEIDENQKIVGTAQSQMYDLDSKNLEDLQRVISVAENNPAKDIGLLKRGFGAGQDWDKIKGNISDANGTLKTAATIFTEGQKYLSGDSLKQMFLSIKAVHMRMQELTSKWIPMEQKAMKDRNNLLAQYQALESQDINELSNAMAQQMKNIEGSFAHNIELMKGISNHINMIIDYVSANKYKSIKEKKNDATGLPKIMSALTNDKLICEKMYNIQIRDLLISQINGVLKILDTFCNGDGSKLKKIDDQSIEVLNMIKQNLDRNINDETHIYSDVKAVLNVDEELRRMRMPSPSANPSPTTNNSQPPPVSPPPRRVPF